MSLSNSFEFKFAVSLSNQSTDYFRMIFKLRNQFFDIISDIEISEINILLL